MNQVTVRGDVAGGRIKRPSWISDKFTMCGTEKGFVESLRNAASNFSPVVIAGTAVEFEPDIMDS